MRETTKISSSAQISVHIASTFWAGNLREQILSGLEIGLFSNYWDKEVRLPENHAPKLLDAYSHTLSKDVRLAQDTSVHWGINFVFWMPRDILVTRSWYKIGLERAWDSLYTSEILIS